MTRHARILVAVEEQAAASTPIEALIAAGHQVRVCSGPQHLASHVEAFRPDLVVLDLPSPNPELLSAIVRRTHASYRPLLLCLVEHGPAQQCAALEAGADVCLNRALTSDVLEVQVRALLRRAPWLVRAVHHVGPIVIDEDAHLVLVDDAPVDLTPREFDLLAMLVRNAGTVLSKRLMLEQLWGFDSYDENLVEVHLSALRRRLPSSARDLIQTVRGVGYVLRASAPQDRLA